MTNRRRGSVVALVVASILAGASLSVRADEAASTKVRVDIPAQDLSAALTQFGRETGTEIVFAPDRVRGKKAAALSGEFERGKALELLLRDSGLTYRVTSQGAIVVEPARTTGEGVPDSTLRFAQDNSEQPTARDESALNAINEPLKEITPDIERIPEVLVKGSRILNVDVKRDEDGALPYVVIDRSTIQKSRAENLEMLLRDQLTASTQSTSNAQSPTTDGTNASQVSLRGLGTDETLILIDGRRIPSFGAGGVRQQPDINGIPLSAVERIEVLPSSASAIYGGGATGGVVNIILRRDYSGANLRLDYGNATKGDVASRRVDVSAGFSLEEGKTHILLSGSYFDRDALLVGDRNFLSRKYGRILATNPDFFFSPFASPPVGSTTNIRSDDPLVNGVRPDLTLKDSNLSLGSPVAFVPYGYAGIASDNGAALLANAGRFNFNLANAPNTTGGRVNLLNEPIAKSLNVTLRRQFTKRLDAFLDINALEDRGQYHFPIAGASFVTLAPDAPGNPFQQQVRVSVPLVGLDTTVESQLQTIRSTLGLIADLGAEWRGELDYTWGRTRYRNPRGYPFLSLTTAVSSGQIDVFRDVNVSRPDFNSTILTTDSASPSGNTLRNPTLLLSGPILSQAFGKASTLTFRFEYRDEAMDAFRTSNLFSATLSPSRSQSATSGYIEALIPFIADRNAMRGVRYLELQIADRYDRYQTNGANSILLIGGVPITPIERAKNSFTANSPLAALSYKPFTDLTIRGSYARGFLPPDVNQLTEDSPSTIDGPSYDLRDTLRGNEFLGDSVIFRSGGNSNLGPEKSTSKSIGLVWEPRQAPGLRFAVDWTSIEKKNAIISPITYLAQSSLDALIAAAPERVIRDPDAPPDSFDYAPIIGIDTTFLNAAKVSIKAVDYSLGYRFTSARAGEFAVLIRATNLRESDQQFSLDAPIEEQAGAAGYVNWRGNAALSWNYGLWSAGWMSRYIDKYFLNIDHLSDINLGRSTVPTQIYHDVFVGYQTGVRQGSLSAFSNLDVQLRIGNVFGKKPPVDTSLFGYSSEGDPRLATYNLSVAKQF